MLILALDLSTHVGWAHDGPAGVPLMNTKHLAGVGGNAKDGFDFGATGATFYRWLDDMIRVVRPDVIGFEAPLMQRENARGIDGKRSFNQPEMSVRLLMGLAFLTETISALHGVECQERHLATVKSFWAGTGRATKDDMMARCRQIGWRPADHNAADAAALWSLLKSEYDPKFSYRAAPLMVGKLV